MGRAVAVDHQSRIGLQHRRRIEQPRQRLGDAGNADVPGDVAFKLARGDAERAERARDQPPGMVGGQQEIRAARGP